MVVVRWKCGKRCTDECLVEGDAAHEKTSIVADVSLGRFTSSHMHVRVLVFVCSKLEVVKVLDDPALNAKGVRAEMDPTTGRPKFVRNAS